MENWDLLDGRLSGDDVTEQLGELSRRVCRKLNKRHKATLTSQANITHEKMPFSNTVSFRLKFFSLKIHDQILMHTQNRVVYIISCTDRLSSQVQNTFTNREQLTERIKPATVAACVIASKWIPILDWRNRITTANWISLLLAVIQAGSWLIFHNKHHKYRVSRQLTSFYQTCQVFTWSPWMQWHLGRHEALTTESAWLCSANDLFDSCLDANSRTLSERTCVTSWRDTQSFTATGSMCKTTRPIASFFTSNSLPKTIRTCALHAAKQREKWFTYNIIYVHVCTAKRVGLVAICKYETHLQILYPKRQSVDSGRLLYEAAVSTVGARSDGHRSISATHDHQPLDAQNCGSARSC